MGRQRVGCLAFGVLFLIVFSILSILSIGTGPAGAAGNDSLDQLIISNPGSEWTAGNPAIAERVVNGLDRLEGDALGPLGVESASAARTWSTSTPNQGLVVALTAFAAKPGGTFKGQVDQQATQGTNPAVLSFCASATSSSPTTNTAIAGIPGSHLATCTTAAGMSLVVAAWAKANVLALAYGSDPSGSMLSTPQSISDLAIRQDAAMPSTATSVPTTTGPGPISKRGANGVGASGHSNTALVVVVIVALLIILSLVFLLLRSRRSGVTHTEGATGSSESVVRMYPPGWYPDPFAPDRPRFWNGTTWDPASPEERTGQPIQGGETPPF